MNFLETTKHKLWVLWYVILACLALLRRAITHDLSKYSSYEASAFRAALPKFRGLEYNSDEYRTVLVSLGNALSHHYKDNSHHPEHWGGQIDNMSPLDQIEMLCDWKAATQRHRTGNMAQSLRANRERFEAPHWFHDALERAAKEIGLLK